MDLRFGILGGARSTHFAALSMFALSAMTPATGSLISNADSSLSYSDAIVFQEPGDKQRGILIPEGLPDVHNPLVPFSTVPAPAGVQDGIVRLSETIVTADSDPSGFSDAVAMKIVGGQAQLYFWSDGLQMDGSQNVSYAQFINALGLQNPRIATIPESGVLQDVAPLLFQGQPVLNRLLVASDVANSGNTKPPFFPVGPQGTIKTSDSILIARGIACTQLFLNDGSPEFDENICDKNPFRNIVLGHAVASKAVGIDEPIAGGPGDTDNPTDVVALQVIGDCSKPPGCELRFGIWSEDLNKTRDQFLADMGNPPLMRLQGDENNHDPILDAFGLQNDGFTFEFSSDPSDVPEPSVMLLVGGGLFLLPFIRRLSHPHTFLGGKSVRVRARRGRGASPQYQFTN